MQISDTLFTDRQTNKEFSIMLVPLNFLISFINNPVNKVIKYDFSYSCLLCLKYGMRWLLTRICIVNIPTPMTRTKLAVILLDFRGAPRLNHVAVGNGSPVTLQVIFIDPPSGTNTVSRETAAVGGVVTIEK